MYAELLSGNLSVSPTVGVQKMPEISVCDMPKPQELDALINFCVRDAQFVGMTYPDREYRAARAVWRWESNNADVAFTTFEHRTRGAVSVINVFPDSNPRCGSRFFFHQGEFLLCDSRGQFEKSEFQHFARCSDSWGGVQFCPPIKEMLPLLAALRNGALVQTHPQPSRNLGSDLGLETLTLTRYQGEGR